MRYLTTEDLFRMGGITAAVLAAARFLIALARGGKGRNAK